MLVKSILKSNYKEKMIMSRKLQENQRKNAQKKKKKKLRSKEKNEWGRRAKRKF